MEVRKDLHTRASRKSEALCAGGGTEQKQKGKLSRVQPGRDCRRAPARKVPAFLRAGHLKGGAGGVGGSQARGPAGRVTGE